MFKIIDAELRHHAPFTAFGAITGIILFFIFRNMPQQTARGLFYLFHPLHVLLSALATASLFQLHTCPKNEKKKCNLPFLFTVGLIGSIGIATLSDSVMPFWGEALLALPQRQYHIGFLEKGWLIAGAATAGVTIAYFNPATKFPHAGHVLLSTWASIFHVIMAGGRSLSWLSYLTIFLFLFLAVWIPCCISDIVFPLLFSRKSKK